MSRADIPFAAFVAWIGLACLAAFADQHVVAIGALVCANVWSAANWLASCDTHPKDGDVKQAPLVSGAVGEAETPNA